MAYGCNKVYINEKLLPENKVFFSKIKTIFQETGCTYAWCRDGKFYVRKANGEKCRRINNLKELNTLM